MIEATGGSGGLLMRCTKLGMPVVLAGALLAAAACGQADGSSKANAAPGRSTLDGDERPQLAPDRVPVNANQRDGAIGSLCWAMSEFLVRSVEALNPPDGPRSTTKLRSSIGEIIKEVEVARNNVSVGVSPFVDQVMGALVQSRAVIDASNAGEQASVESTVNEAGSAWVEVESWPSFAEFEAAAAASSNCSGLAANPSP